MIFVRGVVLVIRFPGVPLWGCNGAKRRSTVARFARLHGSGHGSPPTPSVLSGGPRGATPRISAPKVTLFGGSGGPPGPPKTPPPGTPKYPPKTPRKPPKNPPFRGVSGRSPGGPRGVVFGVRRVIFDGFWGSRRTPEKPPKNAEKVVTFWVRRCESGRGWGGSAHYPDPTAQSAPFTAHAGRTAPRRLPGAFPGLSDRKTGKKGFFGGWRLDSRFRVRVSQLPAAMCPSGGRQRPPSTPC